MEHTRRKVLQALGYSLAGGLALGQASAQTAPFPGKPVRILSISPPGSLVDVFGRAVGDQLAKAWNQPVIMDNRPGAGGMVAASLAARTEPDGYNLLLTVTYFTQAPLLTGKAQYHPLRDFVPVTEMATTHVVLVAHPDHPAKDLRGLIAYGKAQGKPLQYGTYGLGSSAHLQMEIFGRAAGLPLSHVPYKGEAPVLQDLLAGQVPLAVVSAASVRKYAASGKLRALATIGNVRSEVVPDVPTFKEAGFQGVDRPGWVGLLAPAGTPQPVVEKIAADIGRVLAQPEMRARMLENLGLVLKGSTPAAFAEVVKADYDYWGEAIRAANVRVEY